MQTDGRHSRLTRTDLYTDLFETLATYRNAEHARYNAEALVRKHATGSSSSPSSPIANRLSSIVRPGRR